MDFSEQDGAAQLTFTVVETMRVRAQVEVSQANFERQMGVALEEASKQDVAIYLALTDPPYEEASIKERLDDPLFLEIQAVTTEG